MFPESSLLPLPRAPSWPFSSSDVLKETITFQDIVHHQSAATLNITEAGPGQAYLVAAVSVFIKHPEHARAYRERASARGLQEIPAMVTVADICRPGLLFEMDAEVVIRK